MDVDRMKQVDRLVDKAVQSEKSDDALRFSQAACNAANAMAQVQNIMLRQEPK